MKEVVIDANAGYMERVLNEGLCVLVTSRILQEGDAFKLREVNQHGERTGRHFFGRVMHEVDSGIYQFTLSPFMEVEDDQGKPERMPMIGQYANETCQLPDSPDWVKFATPVTGEKPVWFFNGKKWRSEISLCKLAFLNDDAFKKDSAPLSILVKIQQSSDESDQRPGGEKVFVYGKLKEVEPGDQV